jgi:hypothetical protein
VRNRRTPPPAIGTKAVGTNQKNNCTVSLPGRLFARRLFCPAVILPGGCFADYLPGGCLAWQIICPAVVLPGGLTAGRKLVDLGSRAQFDRMQRRPQAMRWPVFVVDICIALLSGAMYCMARHSKTGLCKLVCAEQPNIPRVVPCFVLPVAGCSGQELEQEWK